MKKLFLFATLLFAIAAVPAYAEDDNFGYTITPYVGYHYFDDRFDNSTFGNDNYTDEFEAGLRIEKFFTSRWSAEIGAGYLNTQRQSTGVKNSSTTYLLNAVYNLVETGRFIPYLTAGLAGDYTAEEALTGLDAGIGARMRLTESMFLRPEVRYINLFDGRQDVVAMLGLSFAFGKTGKEAPAPKQEAPEEKPAPAPAPAPAPVPVPPADSDRDGVPDSADKCPDTPSGVRVDANGCPLDSDHDGVPDYLDTCPGTPAGAKVDAQGCVTSITLKINFDTGKSVVKSVYLPEIEKFADFLKQYPDQKAEIQGHTDNVGNARSNKALSEARAAAVREVLISKYGIAADRLTSKGYGQDMPIAGNDTPEGREKNRRVEAVIVK